MAYCTTCGWNLGNQLTCPSCGTAVKGSAPRSSEVGQGAPSHGESPAASITVGDPPGLQDTPATSNAGVARKSTVVIISIALVAVILAFVLVGALVGAFVEAVFGVLRDIGNFLTTFNSDPK